MKLNHKKENHQNCNHLAEKDVIKLCPYTAWEDEGGCHQYSDQNGEKYHE